METTSHEVVVDTTYYKPDEKDERDEKTGDRFWGVKSQTHKVIANIFPTIERFCHSIGIHRDTLHEWANAKYPDDYAELELRGQLMYPEFSDAVKRAKQIQESILVENALQSQYNPTFAIFLAKNNFGYVDKTEKDIKVSPLGNILNELDGAGSWL